MKNKTVKQWQKELGIKIKDSAGIFKDKYYDLSTFMNLASQCELEHDQKLSRRDAAKLKIKFTKKIDSKCK